MSRLRILLVATSGLALAGLAPMRQAAAQVARYCNASLSAVSFYTNILSNGRTSVAVHFVQLQNLGPQRRVRVAFSRSEPGLTRGGGSFPVHPGVAPASGTDIPMGYQAIITVQLATQRLNNPAGSGAISATDPQTGLPHFTAVTCAP